MAVPSVGDVSLGDFPRTGSESSDTGRIRRAVEACPRGVLFIPAGVYEISETIEITNLCSLHMHKSATLRAVERMDFAVKYNATLQHNKGLNGGASEDWNLFIIGGDIDGNGLASCLALDEYHHFTLRDMSLRNALKYGLKVDGFGHGYELIASNIYCKCTMPGLAGNIGISTDGGDSHYTDCIVIDYTIGIEINDGSGSNRLTRCHVWGGPLPPPKPGDDREMLRDSINYKIASCNTILRDCYADTGKTGFLIMGTASLLGCQYFNNYNFLLDDVTCIRHAAGHLLVADSTFIKTSPKAKVYEGIGTDIIWRDNYCQFFEEEEIPKF